MSLLSLPHVAVVSEIGINHGGHLDTALEMIRVSADCGVDACKFQLFTAAQMYNRDAGSYKNSAGEYEIYSLIEDIELPPEWIPRLMAECAACGVEFLMTVCDLEGLAIMRAHGVPIVKVASSEIWYLDLFRAISKAGMDIVFSAGAATLGDIEEALSAYGRPEHACIMHCNASYPTARESVNMSVLQTLRLAFPQSMVGYSDHTLDPSEAPVAAVAMGTRVIEKHFTLDKKTSGPDHFYAMEPEELRQLVRDVRATETALAEGHIPALDPVLMGTSAKFVHPDEEYLRRFAYRSLYAAVDIRPGEPFTRENVAVLRAGQCPRGFHPRELDRLSGRESPVFLRQGTAISFDTLLGGGG